MVTKWAGLANIVTQLLFPLQDRFGGYMATVVVADTGYQVDVRLDRLVECSEEESKHPFHVRFVNLCTGRELGNLFAGARS